MMNHGGFGHYDRDSCACGCRTRVAYNGLEPRFASTACRTRWVDQLAIRPNAETAPAVLDTKPQNPPPAAVSMPAEEIAAAQAEFAQRVTVAPQVEAALRQAPSGMWVSPSPGALWKFLTRRRRKVT